MIDKADEKTNEPVALLSADVEDQTGAGGWHEKPRAVLLNFVFASFCLSANHGTVTALIALASTELGAELAGVSLGLLFGLYTLTAITVASWVVLRMGPKWALVSSITLYCAYVASYLIAYEAPRLQWESVTIGAVLGGIASGLLWCSQGAFFARSAHHYAKAKGISGEEATAMFSGVFSTVYVGLEVLLKLLSSVFMTASGKTTTFVIFTIVAFGSALLSLFMKNPPPILTGKSEEGGRTMRDELLLALRLLIRDRRMQLLAAFNMTFGLTIAVMNLWVAGVPVKIALGAENVGFVASVDPSVATLISLPISILAKRYGKSGILIAGAASSILVALAVIAIPESDLVSLKWGLVFIFVLSGFGRGVFEATNKAVMADFFPGDHEAAFANVIILSGGAAGISFFVFPYLSGREMSFALLAMSSLAVITTPFAFKLHARQCAEKPLLSH